MTDTTADRNDYLQHLSRTMDLVDTIERERSRVDQALHQDDQDRQMLEILRSTYRTTGKEVDDATLKEALQAAREQRFAYTPTPASFTAFLARLYVIRDRWLSQALIVAGGAILLMVAVLSINAIAGATRMRSVVAHANATFYEKNAALATTQTLRSDLDALLNSNKKLAPLLSDAQVALAQIHALPVPTLFPENAKEREAWVRSHPADVEQALVRETTYTAQVNGRLALVREGLTLARGVDQMFKQVPALMGFTLPEGAAGQALAAQVAQGRAALQTGLDTPTKAGLLQAQAAASTLTNIQATGKSLAAAQALVGGFSEKAQPKAQELFTVALTQAAAGQFAAANQQVKAIQALDQQVRQAYQLRIVNEPGVKSGVWRYPNDNTQGKSYYLVVDAVDDQMNPVSLPIRSVEDNQVTQTSRFAVRVPESEYEAVKSDKMDNGLIDKPLVAIKAAGELEPVYSVPVSGGFITSW